MGMPLEPAYESALEHSVPAENAYTFQLNQSRTEDLLPLQIRSTIISDSPLRLDRGRREIPHLTAHRWEEVCKSQNAEE